MKNIISCSFVLICLRLSFGGQVQKNQNKYFFLFLTQEKKQKNMCLKIIAKILFRSAAENKLVPPVLKYNERDSNRIFRLSLLFIKFFNAILFRHEEIGTSADRQMEII